MKKLVILLSLVVICFVGCTPNETNSSNETTFDTTVETAPIVETTFDTETNPIVEVDSESVVESDTCSDITSSGTLDELKVVISSDVENTISGLIAEWGELKSEIDSYAKYVEKVDVVEEFYDKINETSEQICVRLQEYTLAYARQIMSSNMPIIEKCETFDDLLNCIYEDAAGAVLDGIYEELLGDMLDTFYEGVISDSESSASYSEWYDITVNEYGNWFDTSTDVYSHWYDTTVDIYSFYYDMTIELYSNDIEGAEECMDDYEKDIEKLS